ncbi:hypothetical protein EG68_03639 [Paragonimus skrjabini miyazakii]|uniref:Uncharacterized protein n=1 Tax=Paragonimus skrjabini miyazakii TaxID=59628 RepID=A0A8S9YXA0_9TREM|nr:hypothetical protein EG68_03639 [Paragonimus skrjabini miyazakii]
MPAYSKLNRRRRITCRVCGLPFGYVPLSAAYLEANLQFLYSLIEEAENEKTNIESCGQSDAKSEQPSDVASTAPTQYPIMFHLNKNNVDKVEFRARLSKRSVTQLHTAQSRASNILDSRLFMVMFMPDAINIRIRKRCDFDHGQTKVEGRCGIAYHFKFPGEIFQIADAVLCAGCDRCVGVRFEPHQPGNTWIPTSSWRSSRVSTPQERGFPIQRTAFSEDVSENIDKTTRLLGSNIYEDEIALNSVEIEGWIALSLECVDVEPLFGLIGLEQFSIRYEGGEMSPNFYRSIEASNLLSQNSATWMIPARRVRSEKLQNSGRVTNPPVTGWGKTYYDLERSSKVIPHTLGHVDLVEATVRRLYPIYPLERSTAQQNEKLSKRKIE